MRIVTPLVALTLLAGCAPAVDVSGREWTKPGISIQQVTLDATECAREAYAAGWTPDLVLGGVLDVWRLLIEHAAQVGTYNRCIRDRGYQPAEASSPPDLIARPASPA